MTEFIPILIIAAVFSMMLFLIVRNNRNKALVEPQNRMTAVASATLLAVLIADLLCGGNVCIRMQADLMLALTQIMVLTSSVLGPKHIRILFGILHLLQICSCVGYCIWAAELAVIPSERFFIAVSVVMGIVQMFIFIYAAAMRMRNVKSVIQSGTVWSNLGLTTDAVYTCCLLLLSFIPVLLVDVEDISGGLAMSLDILFSMAALAALYVRIADNCFFIIMQNQERIIVESIKISQVEIANGVRPDTYRQVYDRIVDYFETDLPFLKNNLTINDVVKNVFSNKLYISRAISQFTGRNFCQFVNYYRVSYSLERFRNNPDLKITELAQMSGFNSVISYNMAFRLFMNENPGEWCRKERHKYRKKKK